MAKDAEPSQREPYGPPYPTRIEPDLGVPVLTSLGFHAREADRKGTTIEQELEDERRLEQMVDEEFMDDWNDPDFVLKFARSWVREHNRSEVESARRYPKYEAHPEPLPRKVVAIIEVEGGCGFRGHQVAVKCMALQAHGKRGILCVEDSYESGMSYYDPPDGESNVWWEDD